VSSAGTVPEAVICGESGDAAGPKELAAPATGPDTALVVPERSPETSSISIAPEFTATVPSPTPVVAVMPRRMRGPCMFISSVSRVGEGLTTYFGKETSKVFAG